MNLSELNKLIICCQATNNFELASYYRTKKTELINEIKNKVLRKLQSM